MQEYQNPVLSDQALLDILHQEGLMFKTKLLI